MAHDDKGETPSSPPPKSLRDSEDENEENDNAELFTDVLAHLDKDNLPKLALAIRQQSETEYDGQDPVVERPIYGSYNVLLPLVFPDGVRWLAKIPVNGTPSHWNAVSSGALSAEANTMRLLKRETTIPIPTVFDFSATTDNPIRCPYIVMSFISGKPLYEIWFGDFSSEDVTQYRTRALQDIASAMVQLKAFSFNKGGFMTFAPDGNVKSEIGPMRHVDHQAMLDRWFIDKDPADEPIYIESPAFDSPHGYFTFALNLHEETRPFPKGVLLLLELLISCIPVPPDTKPFVLAHPDYDIQNFIVSDTGELQGIIDWDGVAVVPRSIGSERYPGWLTRDWDPAMYGYDESMDKGVEPDGVREDSPKTLKFYRALYRKLVSKTRGDLQNLEAEPDENITRMSLITENLAIAAQDPQCRNDILRKFVEEIAAMSDGKVSLDFMDLVNDFASGTVNHDTIQTLKRGVEVLLMKDDL
ncbi:hypothetical protein AK830_g7316 [Neonectria ditissima]|uniref:Aminoglycoside phosphotransferase domain-containing protein n=1 Tax=Neonectria ditissima TaxID=78410 RepID=A0A0P7BAF9_9HYPO|nr:hypothetical protein AK830_g7316 [Neonectria ditissima]